jgi:hypothetical protein
MAKDIKTTKLSTDLYSDQDVIFSAQALPDSTALSSSAFRFGNTMGRNEIKMIVETAGTLTAALTVEVQSCATEDGSFVTVAGGTFETALGAITAGQELVKYIAPRETTNEFFKVKITTTEDESAMAVDCYIVWVS